MSSSIKFVAIIPAYNEEPTVANVVESALAHPAIAHVMVVDDGSTDRTAKRARNAGATVIRHPRNRGKAQAMQTGTERAPDASHFLFLDADLIGFTRDHITQLLAPIERGAAMSIGIRDRGAFWTALTMTILPWISGERIVARELWNAVPPAFKHGYKIELALNATARRRGERIVPVKLANVSIVRKEQKVGLARGLRQRAAMSTELVVAALELMLQ